MAIPSDHTHGPSPGKTAHTPHWTPVQPWPASTAAWNAWLHAQCDQGQPQAQHWVRQHGAWTHRAISRPLRRTLWAVFNHACVWCGQPIGRAAITVEHVIPLSSPVWTLMTPLEQLLSLRVSHRACNQAYAHWRRRHQRTAQAADLWRWRAIRRILRYDRLWACWIPNPAPIPESTTAPEAH